MSPCNSRKLYRGAPQTKERERERERERDREREREREKAKGGSESTLGASVKAVFFNKQSINKKTRG